MAGCVHFFDWFFLEHFDAEGGFLVFYETGYLGVGVWFVLDDAGVRALLAVLGFFFEFSFLPRSSPAYFHWVRTLIHISIRRHIRSLRMISTRILLWNIKLIMNMSFYLNCRQILMKQMLVKARYALVLHFMIDESFWSLGWHWFGFLNKWTFLSKFLL